MKKVAFVALTVVLTLVTITSCTPEKSRLPVDPYRTPSATLSPGSSQYLDRVSIDPTQAQYFGKVKQVLSLDSEELALIQQNGFVVTDRLAWDRFLDAYAWIYWKDLPVLITTDSILHSVHQSYDDILIDIEHGILIPDLKMILVLSQDELERARAENKNKALDSSYADVSTYLTVALALLEGQVPEDKAAAGLYSLAATAGKYEDIMLFGSKRKIDFTLFRPRGHYAEDKDLRQYFQSMNWLAQVDFRFVEYDPLTSKPILHQSQIAAAAILREAIDSSGQRVAWVEMDGLLRALVGESDNTALPDLDRFMADMGIGRPAAVMGANAKEMLERLLSGDYGDQRITGQLLERDVANFGPEPVPRPVSFMLMGQRFAVDSYILGNLVYDRMIKDGRPIERALPSSLDVMYSLGNDRALAHLQDEINKYGYGSHLAEMRSATDSLSPEFWGAPTYNQWLGMIRDLDTPTIGQEYPQAMRTSAWADKMLQTQLASWAQLRHDNVLYVKQSFTMGIACEYPEGYVEPYPEFYAALYEYAKAGHEAVSATPVGLNRSWESPKQRALEYFSNVMSAAQTLKTLAEKELALEDFTAEEETFLKSVVVRKDNPNRGCGGPTFVWDGWYVKMFYLEDDNPALIVDVHTNPNNDGPLAPARVLHAGTGPAVPICFVAETDEGSTIYVGPSFTYYDVVETGNPPARLTDKEWRSRLTAQAQPHPDWTGSFLAVEGKTSEMLKLK